MAQNIEIAQIGEPILRQQAKKVVDFEGEFLSPSKSTTFLAC